MWQLKKESENSMMLKRKYEKIIDLLGLPKLGCYFCKTEIFLSRWGLNRHIKSKHQEKAKV